MKRLTFRGRNVYTSDEVADLCEISKSTLYNYASGIKNLSLIRGEDFITLNSEEGKEFLRENPHYKGAIKSKFSLYYDSAINKIIEYRDSSSYISKRRNNLKQIISQQLDKKVENQYQQVESSKENFQEPSNKEIVIDEPVFKNQQSDQIDLNLVLNLLLRLDLENRNLKDRISSLEDKIIEQNLLLKEYLTLRKRDLIK